SERRRLAETDDANGRRRLSRAELRAAKPVGIDPDRCRGSEQTVLPQDAAGRELEVTREPGRMPLGIRIGHEGFDAVEKEKRGPPIQEVAAYAGSDLRDEEDGDPNRKDVSELAPQRDRSNPRLDGCMLITRRDGHP